VSEAMRVRKARSLRRQATSSRNAQQKRRRKLDRKKVAEPDDVDRQRRESAEVKKHALLFFALCRRLHVGWDKAKALAARRGEAFDGKPPFRVVWHEGARLCAQAKALFDAVPPSALVISPTDSMRARFKRALEVCIGIVGLAMLEHRGLSAGGKHRSDFELLFGSLQAGYDALSERDRGFDEPLLRSAWRSSEMPREALYERHIKSMSGIACYVLASFGLPKHVAARKVAKVLNEARLFTGKGPGSRSVLNWMTRWQNGDLPRVPYYVDFFGEAYWLKKKGRPEAAQREVLRVLAEFIIRFAAHLRSLQMETSPLS
jgi:hypothetical protein